MSKISRYFIYTLLFIAAIPLVAVLALIFILPVDSFSRENLAHYASTMMSQPVSIKEVDLSWQGINPIIALHDVVIYDDAVQRKLVKVNELQIDVDIIKTLLAFDMRAKLIHAKGAYLTIIEKSEDDYVIEGLKGSPSTLQDKFVEHPDRHLVEWLFSQRSIILEDLSIHLKENDVLIPLHVREIKIDNFYDQHNVSLKAHSPLTNSQLSVKGRLSGHLAALDKWSGDFNLETKNIALKNWGKHFTVYGLQVISGKSDVVISGKIKNSDVHTATTKLNVKNLKLENLFVKESPVFEEINGTIDWQRKEKGWALFGHNIRIKTKGTWFPVTEFLFSSTSSDKELIQHQLYWKVIRMRDLFELLSRNHLLNKHQEESLKIMALQGIGEQVNLSITSKKEKIIHWEVSAGLKNIFFKPHGRIPGVENLNGKLYLSHDENWIDVDSDAMKINIPGVNSAEILPAKIKGKITWFDYVDKWSIHSKDLSYNSAKLQFQGGLDIRKAEKGKLPFGKINVKFNTDNAKDAIDTLLKPFASETNYESVNKVVLGSGKISGQGSYEGEFFGLSFSEFLKGLTLQATFNKLKLNVLAELPSFNDLSGQLDLNNKKFNAEINSGSIGPAKIEKAVLSIPVIGNNDEVLDVKTDMHVVLPADWQFLYDSKIGSHFRLLKKLEIKGKANSTLHLSIPLHKPIDATTVDGTLNLDLSTFHLLGWNINLSDVKGALHFDRYHIRSKNMSATVFDHKVNINIDTTDKEDNRGSTDLLVNGKLEMSVLHKYFPSVISPLLSGSTNYKATVTLDHELDENHVFKIHSDLKGVKILLPYPIGKSADEKVNLNLNAFFGGPGETFVDLDYGKRLSTAMTFKENGKRIEFHSANIRLGGGKVKPRKLAGIDISGSLDRFSLSEWAPYLSPRQEFKAVANAHNISEYIAGADVHFDNFEILNQSLPDVKVKITKTPHYSKAYLSGSTINGVVTIPHPRTEAIKIRLDKLHYHTVKSAQRKTHFTPESLLPLDVIINDLQVNRKDYGRMSLKINRLTNDRGINIEHLRLSAPFYRLESRGTWQHSRGGDKTTLKGELRTTDVNELFNLLYLPEMIEADKGALRFALSWQRSLFDLRVADMSGDLSLKLRDGKIIQIPEDSKSKLSTVKLLNALDIEELLTNTSTKGKGKGGLPFREIDGKAHFARGVAHIKHFELDGTLLFLSLDGLIDFRKNYYNLAVKVEPYLFDSVPAVVAIAGAPAVGAGLWVVNTVAKKSLRKVITFQRNIEGKF